MGVYPNLERKLDDDNADPSAVHHNTSHELPSAFVPCGKRNKAIPTLSGSIDMNIGNYDNIIAYHNCPNLNIGIFTPSDVKTRQEFNNNTGITHSLKNYRTGLGIPETNDIDFKVSIIVESLRDKAKFNSLKSLEASQSTIASTENLTKTYTCKETWYSIALQVAIPFFIAGFGTIGAGLVLGKVENYQVFKDISALIILVPAIIGLKGNLDMCLASRLSTQANLGNLKGKKAILEMILGNLGLVQVQAIVAATMVSFYAIGIEALISNKILILKQVLFVTCCSVMTATASCLILDMFLIGVIFLSKRLHKNPDYVATPLAASIGDVLSLSILSFTANQLYSIYHTHYWIFFVIGMFYLMVALPFWIFIVNKNEYTRKLLTRGWTPVFLALFISGLSGLILDKAVGHFRGFVVFQPIINGIGGNLVSVQSSRISTMLHQESVPGTLTPTRKCCISPWAALVRGSPSAKTARILISMNIPGQILFVMLADLVYNQGQLAITYEFIMSYLTVSVLQIMLLLYIAHILIHAMWKFKIDPDNCAIPILTALGDLFGSSLLLVAFTFVQFIGHEYKPIPD